MPDLVTSSPRETAAREALDEITPAGTVGDLLSETVSDDGTVTVLFEATMLGYPGWHWTVSLAELEGEAPSVLETELMPGDGSLLAPDWVPWSERLDDYRAAQLAAEAAAGDAVDEVDDAEALDDDDLDDDDDDLEDDDADAIDEDVVLRRGGGRDGIEIDFLADVADESGDSGDDDALEPDDDADPDEVSDSGLLPVREDQ